MHFRMCNAAGYTSYLHIAACPADQHCNGKGRDMAAAGRRAQARGRRERAADTAAALARAQAVAAELCMAYGMLQGAALTVQTLLVLCIAGLHIVGSKRMSDQLRGTSGCMGHVAAWNARGRDAWLWMCIEFNQK